MAERKRRVKVYEVDYICDYCGDGHMIPDGIAISAGDHTIYRHRCDNCGKTANFQTMYPTIKYVYKDGEKPCKAH